MKRRGKLKELNAARNATDGCRKLSLVSSPGGCASAQVEMGQMEGCVLVWREKDISTHNLHTDFLEKKIVGSRAQMLCQRHPAHTL